MAPHNNSNITCLSSFDIVPDDLSVDFNEDKIGLVLMQESNIKFNMYLRKVVFDNRIIYRKRNIHNACIDLDKEIYMELYKQNGDMYYRILFEPYSLTLNTSNDEPISENNLRCCFIEYSEGMVLTFNVKHLDELKMTPENVYLTFRS